MKKNYLIIAGVFLFFLITTSIFLSLKKKSTVNTLENSPLPTSIDLRGSNQQGFGQKNNQPSASPINISTISSVETEDFKLQYSAQLKKLVVERKTTLADEKFNEWAYGNNFSQLVGNDELVSKVALGKGSEEEFNPILEFLSIFFNIGQGQSNQPTPANSLTPYPNLTPFPTYSGDLTGKVYYAQCGDFGNTPLPGGCDLCYAGCGPTAVAMIAASYLNPSYNPKTIVDLYQSNGYSLDCNGSFYTDAYELFQKLGFQTTTIYDVGNLTAAQVAPEIRNYLTGGWEVFTLVQGHFFWITDIDSQGNIFAYDSAHSPVPYNENSQVPERIYRYMWGVKK